MTDEAKKKIYQQYRRGESVDALAKRYCRTKTSIYRIINEMRARRILELPLDLHPQRRCSTSRTPRRRSWARCRRPRRRRKKARLPSGLPPYLASLYEVPLLTREQEVPPVPQVQLPEAQGHASCARSSIRRSAKSSVMDEIEQLYDEAVTMKNQIVRANLRLVVSIAKRHVGAVGQLLRAGERRQHVADPGGGEVRLRPRQQVQHVRQLGDHEELRPDDSGRASSTATASARARTRCSPATEDVRSDQYEQEHAQSQREAQVGTILARLDEREQKIIISRFGLDHGHEPLTLKEVGAEMGVTKERVRQIEARALEQAAQGGRRKSRSTLPGSDVSARHG